MPRLPGQARSDAVAHDTPGVLREAIASVSILYFPNCRWIPHEILFVTRAFCSCFDRCIRNITIRAQPRLEEPRIHRYRHRRVGLRGPHIEQRATWPVHLFAWLFFE